MDKYREIFGNNKTVDKLNSFPLKTKINKKFTEIMKRNIVVETREMFISVLIIHKISYRDVWGVIDVIPYYLLATELEQRNSQACQVRLDFILSGKTSGSSG